MNFLLINSVLFFVAKSHMIKYGTISAVDNRTKQIIIDNAVKVVKKYAARGLIAHEIMADNEFKPITDAVAPAFVNLAAAGEHVGYIEVFLRVIQEGAQCIHHALPYGLRWPRVMTVSLTEYIMAMKNDFPAKVGASTTMSPATIVNGRRPLDSSKLTLPFGTYIHLNVDTNNLTNTMKQCAVPSICLGPSSNTQGTYRFMSLDTGLCLHGRTRKHLPITSNIIETVHNLGPKQ